ncbi:MAG: hypothetical protein AB4352_03615 [Hormoscilla sp.]
MCVGILDIAPQSRKNVRSPPSLERKCDRPPVSEQSAIAPWSQKKVRLGATKMHVIKPAQAGFVLVAGPFRVRIASGLSVRSPPGLRQKCDRLYLAKANLYVGAQHSGRQLVNIVAHIYFQNAEPWPPWEKTSDRHIFSYRFI